ncbi:MAG: TIGR04552 family protein [Bdellovibrionales bacterium]|nr:TIGR04552 family protein [Bdellovibrionales bacterium]
MSVDVRFHRKTLEALIGGYNSLDAEDLNISDLEEAYAFMRAYGFDPDNEGQMRDLWRFHMRAVTFIQTELLEEGEEFPDSLSDPNQLKDLAYLLIYASTSDRRENSMQRWACSVLKVIHVLVHLDKDLFNHYSHQIQDQILAPYKKAIYQDPTLGTYLGSPGSNGSISLKKYDTKPFKTSKSSITKLLAKPDEVAFFLLDKMGVRFVTKSLFETFGVLRFLVQNNMVSVPHIVTDQSNNTLYPLNLFLEVCESITKEQDLDPSEMDALLADKLEREASRATYRKKLNRFSSQDYRFIKFITRSLIRIPMGEGESNPFSFFYPYEVQIVDYETYLQNLSGGASHDEYKKRQKRKARMRVLGYGYPSEKNTDSSEEES